MAKVNKEKAPTFTYIKEFASFEEGYKELSNLVPTVKLYGGDNVEFENVLKSLTTVILENPPSPFNENFPNTFSFSINSKEMGFLTDDAMAFGYRMFADKKAFVYQFRVTFLALSVRKRMCIDRIVEHGWKERDLSDKQSRFWSDLSNGQRPVNIKRNEVQNLSQKTKNSQKVSLTVEGDKKHTISNTPVETINTKEEEPVQEAVVIEDPNYPRLIVEEPITIQDNAEIINTKEEDAVDLTGRYTGAAKSVVTITESDAEIAQRRQSEETKMKYMQSCRIIPGTTPSIFIINHFGNQIVININDRNDGVYIDRASYIIKIDNVLYNYKDFKVSFLEADYQPEQAQFVPGTEMMRQHEQPTDEDFVGGKMVNERQAEVPEHTIVAPPKPQITPIQQQMLNQNNQQQNYNLIPPVTQQSVLKTGRTLVIDKSTAPVRPDGVVDSVVRIQDAFERPPMEQ